MNLKFRGRNLFRAMYFAPYVLGVAVVAVLWRYLLDTNIGLVNHYLDLVGLSGVTPWLTSLPWAWISLIGATVWWTLGFNTVIYLAALQDISPELYEAAKMDGASACSGSATSRCPACVRCCCSSPASRSSPRSTCSASRT